MLKRSRKEGIVHRGPQPDIAEPFDARSKAAIDRAAVQRHWPD
jgi:hypothetical protein